MAEEEATVTDDLFLKLDEEKGRQRRRRDWIRNRDYFPESMSANKHEDRYIPQKTKLAVNLQKNLTVEKSNLFGGVMHLRNRSSSRQSCNAYNSNLVNDGASTSKDHWPDSTTNLNFKLPNSRRKEEKDFHETRRNKYCPKEKRGRNQSLNRKQFESYDTEMCEVGNYVKTMPLQRSLSTQSLNRPSRHTSNSKKVEEKHGHFVRLGYKRLQELCKSTPTDIITCLMRNNSGFEDLLNSNLRPDLLVLVINVLAKACTCDFAINKAALLSITCQSNLLDSIENHILRMPSDDSLERKQTMGSFIFDLLVFYETVMKILPNTSSERFKKLFISTEVMMNSVEIYHGINLSKQKEQFNLLNKQLKSMIEEREIKKEITSKDELLKYSAPPDNFREINIYPTQNELFGERKPFLRPNITNGAYLDIEHYLDVQFRLLREDFVAPLREGLATFLDDSIEKKKRNRNRVENIRIYRYIRFGNPKTVNNVVGIEVCFDPKKKLNIKWEYSKRLMFGSLLLFTNNNFKEVIFGTILDRNIEYLRKGQIIVELHQQNDKLNVFESDFIMVEAEVYFEPYKHVLRALQRLDDDSFPMKDYIIFVQKECSPPKYVLEHPMYMYKVDNFKIEILNKNSWPSDDELNLDRSQLAAFRAALTEEFVIIQGPPGTGKTFLGLKIAKVLLENCELWNANHSPILVVCYTNHALDQFLEGLLSTTDNIVRVGGQSKSPILSKYNIKEIRKAYNFKRANFNLKREYYSAMSELMESIKIMQANLEELEGHRGIVSFEFMRRMKIISSQQSHCFEQKDSDEDTIMCDWLMEGFEEQYGYIEHQESSVFEVVGGKNEKNISGNISENNDGIDQPWLTADYDPVLFDFGTVTHDLKFAIDLHYFKKEIEQFQSMYTQMMNSNLASTYDIEEDYLYRQQMFQYWKNCLQMNHRAKAAHVQMLHTKNNIWQLSIEDRWLLYKDWVYKLKIKIRRAINENEKKYREYAKRYDEVKQMCDFEIMQNALVVGMTTTNAARLQHLIRALKSKIVIVEEAAEVFESHIVVSLTNKCEHVILIGDHKQLRPAPAVFKLARDYHFDISLFERMVNNGMQYHCLENQHRMRPEIAQLIAPTIYPELKNDKFVYNYATVRGITKSLFFLTHNIYEEEVDEILSHKNSYEADFILALCRHLILQGYQPNEITILATYKGQLIYMRERQRRHTILSEVNITIVDNYQGEENKIILLSLVRSNAEGKIGFLRIENRVCVALSRAKEGLYIIGNMDNLEQSSKIWPQIKDSLIKQESFGTHITLQCQIHPDQKTLVNRAEDFKKVPEGGCSLLCNIQLECGHLCAGICHVNNREHKEYKCYENCERIHPECEFQHRCPKKCHENCGKCETYVERTLPCGHVKTLECYIDSEEYKCLEKVKVSLPHCDHEVTKCCYQDAATYPCTVSCPDRLPCGHSCLLNCHVLADPDHLEYKCTKRCSRTNAGCTENHMCTKFCYEECGLCTFEVEKKLPNCNHVSRMECFKDPESVLCTKRCSKKMECGHPCPRKCFEPCGGCQVKVKKIIPSCGHEINIKCCETPDKSLCKRPCARLLPCQHGCLRRCGQECTDKCHEFVDCPVTPLCGHSMKIPCHLSRNVNSKSSEVLQYCKFPCEEILSCGHKCKGTCGDCMQGRIHVSCSEKCDRSFICGHKCKVPCATACPPCSAKCLYKCKHSRCNRKCGVPCAPCKEKCDWKCEHLRCTKFCHELCDRKPCYEPCKKELKCGHNCIGFCGDLCPSLCRICNEDEVTEIFLGNEDNENARFVYLVDCKHTLESEGLEKWLQKSENEINQKTCPKCKTAVMRTERFMNYVKLTNMDISRVKRKVFGENINLGRERKMLLNRLSVLKGYYSKHTTLQTCSREYKNMLEMCINQLDDVRNYRRNYLSQTELQCMKSQIEIFTDLVTSIDCVIKRNVLLKTHAREKIFHQFDCLLIKMKQRHGKFSIQETSDFNRECKRFFFTNQLAILESSANFSHSLEQTEVKLLYERACLILQSFRKFTNEQSAELKTIFVDLKKFVGISLTERERKDIVQAMGLAKGHWFKCPNGHIYCIDRCGGAMEVAKCPDCGEDIGGSDHHLLRTNALASEMDGATRHAFPGGLY